MLGRIHASDGRWADARHAFERASSATVDNRAALQSLAIVQLQMGETVTALGILTRMASASPRDIQVRLTLARGAVRGGQNEEAAQELDEVRNRRAAGSRVDVRAGDRVPADRQGGPG